MTLPRDRPRAHHKEGEKPDLLWCQTCREEPYDYRNLESHQGHDIVQFVYLAQLERARAQITALAQETLKWKARAAELELMRCTHFNGSSYSFDDERKKRLAAEAQVAALTVQLEAKEQEQARRHEEPAICLHCGHCQGVNLYNELAFTICNACWVADCDRFAAQLQRAESAEDQVAALTVERERLKAELEKKNDDARFLTRVDRQGVISDDSVPQGRTRGAP